MHGKAAMQPPASGCSTGPADLPISAALFTQCLPRDRGGALAVPGPGLQGEPDGQPGGRAVIVGGKTCGSAHNGRAWAALDPSLPCCPARQATLCCVARWLPLQFTDDQARVVYKRPTDLRIKEDVPICCNLLIAPILDEGGCGGNVGVGAGIAVRSPLAATQGVPICCTS